MTEVILATLTAYILACLVGSSSLFDYFRDWFKRKTAGTVFDKKPKHFIECRLCLTFWTSCLSVLLFWLHPIMILPVYGLAYFMATQER